MNILFICNHLQYSDGVAICLKNLVNALSEVFDIDILNLYKYNSEFAKDISPKVTVYNYFGLYFKGLRSFTNLFLLRNISKHKVFRNNHYDIVISYQYGTPSNLISYIKKHNIQPQAKTVGVIHGFSKNQLELYRDLDSIISISEDGRIEAEKNLPQYSGKLVHLRNIYCVNQIIEKSEMEFKGFEQFKQKGKIIFCTVSRLSPEKGIDRFVRAISEIHKNKPEIVGVIVGDGILFHEIKELIHEQEAEDYIFMMGTQKNPYPYIKNSDYFCCPSRSEGLCTTCVEAAILHKPILSTCVSGAVEIVENPNIGYIIPNDDDSLKNGIETILDMSFEENKFEESGKKWDPELIKDSYVHFFNSL